MGKSKNKIVMKKFESFIIFILFFFSSCVTWKPVEVKSVDNFVLKDIIAKPNIQFDVIVHNPNNFGLTLKEFQSTAFLGDRQLTDIYVEKKIYIDANSDVSIPLQTQPSIESITTMFMSGSTSKDIRVEGYIVVKKFLFKKKFPFTVKTKI